LNPIDPKNLQNMSIPLNSNGAFPSEIYLNPTTIGNISINSNKRSSLDNIHNRSKKPIQFKIQRKKDETVLDSRNIIQRKQITLGDLLSGKANQQTKIKSRPIIKRSHSKYIPK